MLTLTWQDSILLQETLKYLEETVVSSKVCVGMCVCIKKVYQNICVVKNNNKY